VIALIKSQPPEMEHWNFIECFAAYTKIEYTQYSKVLLLGGFRRSYLQKDPQPPVRGLLLY
jgi:hypothetical protein